jgi:hypothetical protein
MAQGQNNERIVVEVPRGQKDHVHVVETDAKTADITIRVARERKTSAPITVGVIQK